MAASGVTSGPGAERGRNAVGTPVLLSLPLNAEGRSWSFEVPDLGLLYLATAVHRHHGDTFRTSLRATNLAITDRAFVDYLQGHRFAWVGLKVMSSSLSNARRTVALVRRALPDALVVLGGPHVTGAAEQALRQIEADFAIQGDGEEGLIRLLGLGPEERTRPECLATVPGLIWREGADLRKNGRAVLWDLDGYGVPLWDRMPPGAFPRFRTRDCRRYPAAPLLLTRGCPSRCTFCAAAGTPFRLRRLAAVLEELELLRGQHGVREFHLLDDNSAHDRAYLLAFCQALIKSDLDWVWRIPSGVRVGSMLSPELCAWMKRSGCYQVWFGIESGSERMLAIMHKGQTVAQIRRAVSLVKESGMEAGGFFLLGYPGETRADRQATLELALSLPLDYAKFTVLIPHPGTGLFRALSAGETPLDDRLVVDCADNDFANHLTDVSARALRSEQQWFSARFYGRAHVLWRLFQEAESWDRLVLMAHHAQKFIFNRRSRW
jgi:anaerobic magnesium-protoporphyrin IX monomethyl ester cyclase